MRSWVIGSMAALMVAAAVRDAHAQPWSMDLSVGRIDYPAVTTDVGTAHLMGTLRYDVAPWASLYGGGALPLRGGDPFWTNVGGAGRWVPAGARRTTFGVDVASDGFVFRDRLAARTGSGGSLHALPFARVAAPFGHVEVRAGWRGQTLSLADTSDRRGVFETGGRVVYTSTLQLESDVRLVHADGTTYPFIGGAISGGYPLEIRVEVGKWLGDLVSETAWSAGVTAPLGHTATLWAGVRQDAPDPLYWNASRRTWSVGVTRHVGRPRAASVAGPARAGTVEIRIPIRDVAGDSLSVAGDFTNWQPMPMRRDGEAWVVRVPLTAGVYHYAFRSGTGDWFVPASITSRRSDGFGGDVAVLVVSG